MILRQRLSLLSFKNVLVYTESSSLLNLSFFGVQKIKMSSLFIFFYNSSSLVIHKSIFLSSQVFNSYWFFFLNLYQSFFFSSMNAYFNGFRILGRGYKAYLHLNNILFRLGYSHNIYYTVPLTFRTFLKSKNQAFWMIRGLDKLQLSTLISLVHSFKIPNTYRHKGVYRMNESYKVKNTKKGAL